jgi:hypothetical protein
MENVHGWIPLMTPEEDNPTEGELRTFITLSKPRNDPRDPLPIIKPRRLNEHTLRVTELVSSIPRSHTR